MSKSEKYDLALSCCVHVRNIDISIQGMLRGVGVTLKMLLMRCLQQYLVVTGQVLCLTVLW